MADDGSGYPGDGNPEEYDDVPQGGYIDEGDEFSGGEEGQGEDWMPANHPLMERVQKALNKQLTDNNEKLTLDLREADESVTQMKKERERIGVELYGFQQGLAKLQMQLEKTHDRYNAFQQMRGSAEEELKVVSQLYEQKLKDKSALEKKRVITQKELDKLKITVKQIEDFNEKLKSEILITRRAAYGTEENMQKLEKQKLKQDELIDNLNEQLRGHDEQIRLYDAQMEAQKIETSSARETLQEATKEMELIAVEKREYLQKWKSSLIGMANRDQALQKAEEALHQQQEHIQNVDREVIGYKKSIQQEQEENEKRTALLTRIESEIKFVDEQLQSVAETRKTLNEKYVMLRDTLEATDKELETVKQEQRLVRSDIDHIHKQYEKRVQEKQKLDDVIMENVSNQTTIEKGAQNVWKNTQKLKQEIHEKEIKMGEIQNEVARIKVDALNTGAHNKELEQTLSAYDKELKEKDKLIEKYETEIRQRLDKIEKKQIYIARLNRKYEQLTSNKQDENTGPLEATIKNLTKEINNKQKESNEKQREWIKTQTELVSLVSETTGIQENVKEQNARLTILSQKSIRLNNSFEQEQDEIKELKNGVRAMHNDMKKLNELIAKNRTAQEELANSNFTMETDFKHKLKEMEVESVKADAAIEAIKQEKERLLAELVEVEKQIMLWEKKIQLEKETQEALDPEYGQPEIQGMKKEIHRMTLRLGQLKRQQEKMIQEMERTIAKRETIKLGGMSSKASKVPSKATVRNKIVQLKGNLKQNVRESQGVANDIQRQEEQNQILLEELEKQQHSYSEVEDRQHELTEDLDANLFRRQMNAETLTMFQKRSKRYDDAISGRLRVQDSKERLGSELMRQEEKLAKIKDAIARLADENPKYKDWFQRLAEYT